MFTLTIIRTNGARVVASTTESSYTAAFNAAALCLSLDPQAEDFAITRTRTEA